MKNVIVLTVLLLAAAPAAAQSKDQQQILALEIAMGKAVEVGDAVSYDKMTTDDFQFITGGGCGNEEAGKARVTEKRRNAGIQNVRPRDINLRRRCCRHGTPGARRWACSI